MLFTSRGMHRGQVEGRKHEVFMKFWFPGNLRHSQWKTLKNKPGSENNSRHVGIETAYFKIRLNDITVLITLVTDRTKYLT